MQTERGLQAQLGVLEDEVSSMANALQATSLPNLKALEQEEEERFDEVLRGTAH